MKRIFIAVFAVVIFMFSCEREISQVESPQIDEFVAGEIGDVVPDEYIVVLNTDMGTLKSMAPDYKLRQEMVRDQVRTMTEKAGLEPMEIDRAYAAAVTGFSAKMDKDKLEAIRQLPDVKGVWPNRVFILKKPGTDPADQPDQSIPYGIARVGYGDYTGSSIAWIIDTGIDLDHSDLNVNTTLSTTFVDRTTTGEDDNGHGTHCAGIVAAKNNDIGVVGVAAGAEVVAVKVLNKRGSGTMDAIIAGVDYVAANSTPGDVANMSLGGGVYEPLDLAVESLGDQGVLVALAAGNESDDANNHSPARANGTNIYTVSAMDSDDIFASFSNYGNPPIDYCAPGVSILSTYKSDQYATMSGTSMAAPHVCGLLLATGGSLTTDGYVISDPDGDADPIAHK